MISPPCKNSKFAWLAAIAGWLALIALNSDILISQLPGGSEEAYFEGVPYEWWIEGGKKSIEAGQLVGAVRANNMDPDTTVYTLVHSYNGGGELNIVRGREQTK